MGFDLKSYESRHSKYYSKLNEKSCKIRKIQHLIPPRPKHVTGRVRFDSLLAALRPNCLLVETLSLIHTTNPLPSKLYRLLSLSWALLIQSRSHPGACNNIKVARFLSEGNLYDAVVRQAFCEKPAGWRSEIFCDLWVIRKSFKRHSVMGMSNGLTLVKPN